MTPWRWLFSPGSTSRRLKLLALLACLALLPLFLYLSLTPSFPFSSTSLFLQIASLKADITKPRHFSIKSDVAGCFSGGVFPGMLRGRWEPQRNVSEARRREMDEFLVHTRAEYRIPRTLQRPDGRCGTLPYEGVPLFHFMWLRSVCNPAGPTPCCHVDRCTNHSPQDCQCPGCLDSRVPVHAELSDWMPAENSSGSCRPHEFSATEACEILSGTSLVFAGDSFVRHAFVALVMLLTGNYRNGALDETAPPGVQQMCQGMYQINGLRCREILKQNRTLCGGKVKVIYLEIFRAGAGRFLLPRVMTSAERGERVLLLAGLGIHDDFRSDLVWSLFLSPLVEYFTGNHTVSQDVLGFRAAGGGSGEIGGGGKGREEGGGPGVRGKGFSVIDFSRKYGVRNSDVLSFSKAMDELQKKNGSVLASLANTNTTTTTNTTNTTTPLSPPPPLSLPRPKGGWPKMVWASTHAPGLLKTPVLPAQSYAGVKFYNEQIAQRLEPLGVPILDSFNMTAPLHSVDGTHYGYGANALKVNFLLHWVQEQQSKGEWW